MAVVDIPIINPIRFRSGSATTSFPTLDKMRNNYNHQRGITANPYYIPDWKLNQQITILVYTTLSGQGLGSFTMFISTPTGIKSMTRNEITYSGWTGGNKIYAFSYTPTIEGEYYLDMSFFGYISDIFYVRKTDADMVELRYYDSRNRYGGVFFNDIGDLIWQPMTYFTGYYTSGDPKNNYSIIEDDPGIIRKLNAEPQRIIDVVFTDISYLELDKLNHILSCDNIYFNNMPTQNAEIQEVEKIEKSDMRNVSVKFMLTDNDYMVKNH